MKIAPSQIPLKIVAAIETALTVEPNVPELVTAHKHWVDALFKYDVLDLRQRDSIKAHIDAFSAAVIANKTPPEFLVEQDPS